MGFSADTKLSEIMDNPAAKAIMQKHYPEMVSMGPMINMGRGLSLKQIAAFPQAKMSQERLETIVKDLQTLDKPAG
jgi:hypothetical protein